MKFSAATLSLLFIGSANAISLRGLQKSLGFEGNKKNGGNGGGGIKPVNAVEQKQNVFPTPAPSPGPSESPSAATPSPTTNPTAAPVPVTSSP
eukprot:CAMPEP_0194200270 /NCGR_PEP_ID=MMETSP0156-20130528/950_1 /TAXON_ID=33649 /ORGANISM="Thalassionema nitzschioides, Strain L26-B" /LENGTH=92 /DNA_ID=CAMNT_0038925245 /DNA_START=67 /DNA_END=341 /DNA_ORIENTATION=+